MFRLFAWLLCAVGFSWCSNAAPSAAPDLSLFFGSFDGCVERENRAVFFAVRISGEKNASGREAREIAEAILKALKI